MSTQPVAPQPAPGPERAVLSATELRKIAEWAHSVREPGHSLVVHPRRPDEPLEVELMRTEDTRRFGDDYLKIPIDTKNRISNRQGVVSMRLGVLNPKKPGSTPASLDFFEECRKAYRAEPDAMFWTESAVEKFLVPYYAAIYSSDAQLARRIQEIADAFDGKLRPRPHAILRLDGESVEVRRLQEEEQANLKGDTEVTVYAMVHLPKSEYVASPPGEPTLGVLYSAKRNGTEQFMFGSLPGRG